MGSTFWERHFLWLVNFINRTRCWFITKLKIKVKE